MFKEKLAELFSSVGIKLSDTALENFEIYKDFLTDYNKITNLTAITDENEIAVKHFLDSAYILAKFPIKQNAKLVDIGTGAGFPGVPLKILQPDINLTLLDSLNKRLIFLEKLCAKLDINANIVHARAEDCNSLGLRSSFDVVVSRAVAPLNILLEFCVPYVKRDGVFIAMKGSNSDEELLNSKNAFSTMGVENVENHKITLPDGSRRALIVIKKIAETPEKFPRQYSKIKKKPL